MSLKEYVGDIEALRHLGIRVTPAERANQRITSEEIAQLKVAVRKKPLVAPVRKMIYSIAHALASTLAAMLPRQGVNKVCQRYGHAIALRDWREHLPKCRDCGKTIRSQNELRSALPKFS